MAPGIARLARSASASTPVVSATASPVSRSVATAANGRGRVRKSRTAAAGHVRR